MSTSWRFSPLPCSLRARLLLMVVAGTLLAATVLLVTQRTVLQSSYAELERQDSQQRAEQAQVQFAQELESLDFTLRDWAVWDETYDYVHSPTLEYEQANLTLAALAAINLDLLAISDSDGRQLAVRTLRRETAEPRPLEEFDSRSGAANPLSAILALAYVDPDAPLIGIVQLESGPMLIGARAVLPTNESEPPGGVMVMARMLDAGVVEGLSRRAGVSLAFVAADAGADLTALTLNEPLRIRVIDGNTARADMLLSDLDGRPVGTLGFEMGRPIAESARETFSLLAIALVLAMLGLGAGLVVATDRALVAPLHAVTQAVREIGRSRDGDAVVPVPPGEIGALARGVNGMLAELSDAARERHRKEQRFRAMVAHSSDAIGIVSETGHLLFSTPSTTTVWGRSPTELYAQPLQSFVVPEDARALGQLFLHGPRGASSQRLEVRVAAPEGEPRTIEVVVGERADWEETSGWVVDARDVTDRVRFSAELQRQATHDDLTGLANRSALTARMEVLLAAPAQPVAVLFLDLDNFKLINDTLGHRSGDILLRAVAERLRNLVGATDFVARLGGDEFVVVMESTAAPQAMKAAQTIVRALSVPIAFEGQQVAVSTSVGVAVDDARVADAQSLLRNADIALYRAKAAGRGGIVMFDPVLDALADAERQLELLLPGATQRGEIVVHYQPIVDLASRHAIGIEALARWNSPRFGLVEPERFLRAACENGEVVELGRFVLRDACARVASLLHTWATPGLPLVSVNISAREFVPEGFYDEVTAIVREADVPPACLQLEITEDAVIGDLEGAIDKLARFRAFGIRIALDDFGTGYSSLSCLDRLPISAIKLDPTLVANVAGKRRARGVVGAVLQLAAALDVTAIAEGVETEEQAQTLISLGAHAGQGHHFGSPVPFEQLVLTQRSDRAAA